MCTLVAMTLSKPTTLLSCRGESSHFSVLHDIGTEPLHIWSPPYGLVEGVHHDYLVVLVRRVLSNPITVQYSQTTASSPDTLLCHVLETPLEFQLVDTLIGGFTVGGTLGYWPLATSTADTYTVDAYTLLGPVP